METTAATSLWELRRRPMPRGVASPLPKAPSPAKQHQQKTAPRQDVTKKAGKRRKQGTECVETPAATPLMACLYRQGQCSNPRTMKRNGTLHTLCEFHRARSIASQWRFDERKRQQKRDALQGVKEKAQKRRASYRRRAEAPTRADTTVQQAKSSDRLTLPSFKAFTSSLTLPRAALDPASAADHDSPRAWLRPFETNGAFALASMSSSSSTWRAIAESQFLHAE